MCNAETLSSGIGPIRGLAILYIEKSQVGLDDGTNIRAGSAGCLVSLKYRTARIRWTILHQVPRRAGFDWPAISLKNKRSFDGYQLGNCGWHSSGDWGWLEFSL